MVHLTGRYNQPGAQWQAQRLLLEFVIPWARGREPLPQIPDGRIFELAKTGDWPRIDLGPAELSRYAGTYDHEGRRTAVWEEGGLLRTTDLVEQEGLPLHLVPLGSHLFAFGRYEARRLHRIYFPQYRLEFEMHEGRATGYREWKIGGAVTASARRAEEPHGIGE